MSDTINPMSVPRITKVCVNIGVGEGGDRLVNAENVLERVRGGRRQGTRGRRKKREEEGEKGGGGRGGNEKMEGGKVTRTERVGSKVRGGGGGRQGRG